MKRLIITALLSIAAAGHALAADLPQPAPPLPQAPAVYVAPVYNWAGVYIGINGGYGFGSSTWTDPANTSLATNSGSFNIKGGLVGGTLGVNSPVRRIRVWRRGRYRLAGHQRQHQQCILQQSIARGGRCAGGLKLRYRKRLDRHGARPHRLRG